MKILLVVALITLGSLMGGCDPSTKAVRRLHIPKGNAENGRTAFIALKCTECHTIAGVDLPKPTKPADKVIALGGEVVRMRSVGDLLTSIIHPGFAISEKMPHAPGPPPKETPMPVTNDVMTVTQMIDLVAFLQPHYKELPIPYGWESL